MFSYIIMAHRSLILIDLQHTDHVCTHTHTHTHTYTHNIPHTDNYIYICIQTDILIILWVCLAVVVMYTHQRR